MKFDKFLGKLEEGSLKPMNEEVGDKPDEALEGGNWFYVPDKTFLNGLMKVAVEELGNDKWKIHYFAPASGASAKAKEGAKGLMAHQEIQHYMDLLQEAEKDTKGLEGWQVAAEWSGDFASTLEKCVNLVEGKVDSDIKGKVQKFAKK